MPHYPTDGPFAVEPRPLAVGDEVKLAGDRQPWTVRAVTPGFAALARPVTEADLLREADSDLAEEGDDGPDGRVYYTVIDWRYGVRGPCNLSGQAWGDGSYTEEQCAEMLAEFETGELEVSSRNCVTIAFADVPAV